MGRKSSQKQARNKTPGSLAHKRELLNAQVDKIMKASVAVDLDNSSIKDQMDFHVKLTKLLDTVKKIELELNITTCPIRSDGWKERLTDWMTTYAAHLDGVTIGEFPEYGCGLQATKDIKDGDLLVTVPRRLMMLWEAANKSELNYLIGTDPILKIMPNIVLAVFLLLERFRKPSFWQPYIESLPPDYNMVLSFTPEDMLALKGSPVLEPSLKQFRGIARQYSYLQSLFQRSEDPASLILKDNFTFENYRWAVSTVMTRQNYVPSLVEGEANVLGLIPYWDLGNHENGKLTTGYSIEENQSEYFASRDFPSGSQVFMFYGERPNSDFFLHSGFVYPENQCDGFKLKLGVSKMDPLYNSKVKLMTHLGIPSSGEFVLCCQPHFFDKKLLAFGMIFNMEQEMLEKWLSSEKRDELIDTNCGNLLEFKMWDFLRKRLSLLLAGYPTTIEEDEGILKSSVDLGERLKLAVQLRLSEKKILKNTLEYIESNKLEPHPCSVP